MTSFETKVNKLIHKQLLDCLDNLIEVTPAPATDTKDPPSRPAKSANQTSAGTAKRQGPDDPTRSGSSASAPFYLAEFRAMRDTFANAGTMTSGVLVQLRTAYAKVNAVAKLEQRRASVEFQCLDSLLSLYKSDGSLRETAARLYYIRHLMKGLDADIQSKSKLRGDLIQDMGHGIDLGGTIDKITATANAIVGLIAAQDWCDCDEVNEDLKKLRELLCRLQEDYQHLLCLQDLIINWPGFQPVLEASLRSWIGSLGAFIAEAWIIFRGIKHYDECECHCDDLNQAWVNIQQQTAQLRDRLGQRCDEQISLAGRHCMDQAARLVAIAEKGAKLSSGRHCCEIGCKDRAGHRELAESLQEAAQCLQIEMANLCKPFATNAFDLIWPEIATILFCVDPCEEEPDECDVLVQNLKCMIESWKIVSERAEKTKLRPNRANVTCCGHQEIENCCSKHEAGHDCSDRYSVTAAEIREEIARAEKLKEVDASTGRLAGIDLCLKKLHAAMTYQGSAICDRLVTQARATLGSIEAVAQPGLHYRETAPTSGAIVSVSAA